MNPDLLALLACPACRGDLDLVHEPDTILTCRGCGVSYPIIDGIPRFVGPERGSREDDVVADQFQTEFTALAQGDQDMDPFPIREYYFFTRSGLDPRIYERLPGDPYRTTLPSDPYVPDSSALRNRVVLDAGCGPARFTEVAAKHGAKLVVGLEVGDHVDRAAERCNALMNVAFVQGSILRPPFKPGAFDIAFSIGVLHHTGRPREAARAMAGLVRPGGTMAVWVYPPEYWGRGLQRFVSKALHKIISRREPTIALRLCERWLYPLGRVQMKVHRFRSIRYVFAPLFIVKVPRHPLKAVMVATIFDFYAPRHISTHQPHEVMSWLERSGFHDVTELPVRSSAKGKRSEDPSSRLQRPVDFRATN